MSTAPNELSLEAALQSVPARFRTRLIKNYTALKSAYVNNQHDSAGLRAGKLCETVLRLLQDDLTGTYTAFGTKINNFGAACVKLEQVPKAGHPESLRVVIPRGLNFLYTLRNKRGIGHEGGDVDANEIDAATCVRVADWVLCELIRVFHTLSLEEAQAVLDAIAVRQTPYVWSVAGKKRVLHASLTYKQQTLALLNSEPDTAVPAEEIFAWTEHSNYSVFKRDVLIGLHKQRLVEYDRETEMVMLSPTGAKEVEDKILPKIAEQM